jgi:peptidoglycan LD-endopeptidase CwlK
VAAGMGLTWGGHWKMMDLGHIEWRKPGVKLGVPPPPAS